MTHKLLLADDSVTIQRVVELTFSGEDVQVVTVGDGEQAIARIPIERPDIVLADIGMPKRSGYDVSAFVKNRPDLWHIPVLLLAGAFEPVDDARAQQVKCDGVLVKPFEPQQVVSRVRELVEGARERAVHPVREINAPEPVTMKRGPIAAPEPIREEDPFEALDAAFAGLSRRTDAPSPMSAEADDFRTDVPTLDKLLGSTPLRDTPVSGGMSMPLPASAVASVIDVEPQGHAGDAAIQPATEGSNLILEAFHALLAKEQGEPVAPVRYSAPSAPPATVTDELVDEVTRRVIERLAPDTAKGLVRQIVSEVAERLIRDEIARIKAAVNTRR